MYHLSRPGFFGRVILKRPDPDYAWNFEASTSLEDSLQGYALTYSRPSSHTYYDGSGFVDLLPNEPGFAYAPGGELRGLMLFNPERGGSYEQLHYGMNTLSSNNGWQTGNATLAESAEDSPLDAAGSGFGYYEFREDGSDDIHFIEHNRSLAIGNRVSPGVRRGRFFVRPLPGSLAERFLTQHRYYSENITGQTEFTLPRVNPSDGSNGGGQGGTITARTLQPVVLDVGDGSYYCMFGAGDVGVASNLAFRLGLYPTPSIDNASIYQGDNQSGVLLTPVWSMIVKSAGSPLQCVDAPSWLAPPPTSNWRSVVANAVIDWNTAFTDTGIKTVTIETRGFNYSNTPKEDFSINRTTYNLDSGRAARNGGNPFDGAWPTKIQAVVTKVEFFADALPDPLLSIVSALPR